jgi:hypothetical protein
LGEEETDLADPDASTAPPSTNNNNNNGNNNGNNHKLPDPGSYPESLPSIHSLFDLGNLPR